MREFCQPVPIHSEVRPVQWCSVGLARFLPLLNLPQGAAVGPQWGEEPLCHPKLFAGRKLPKREVLPMWPLQVSRSKAKYLRVAKETFP